MIMSQKNEKLIVLKNEILASQFTDPEGRTELDVRADDNKTKIEKNKIEEEDLVIELVKYLQEFKSSIISRLISYIKRSSFSDARISAVFLSYLEENLHELDVYQRAELLRYILSNIPNEVNLNLIQQGIADLKTSKPWLYAEILSIKFPYGALEFVKFLIHSNNYNSIGFINLLTKWIKIQDLYFLDQIRKKIIPILKDENAIKIFYYQVDKKRKKTLHLQYSDKKATYIPQSLDIPIVISCSFKEFHKKVEKVRQSNYTPEYAN